ncbi:MAG: hypothetical protein RSD64_03735, partial [Christensenellaceae bacterium]
MASFSEMAKTFRDTVNKGIDKENKRIAAQKAEEEKKRKQYWAAVKAEQERKRQENARKQEQVRQENLRKQEQTRQENARKQERERQAKAAAQKTVASQKSASQNGGTSKTTLPPKPSMLSSKNVHSLAMPSNPANGTQFLKELMEKSKAAQAKKNDETYAKQRVYNETQKNLAAQNTQHTAPKGYQADAFKKFEKTPVTTQDSIVEAIDNRVYELGDLQQSKIQSDFYYMNPIDGTESGYDKDRKVIAGLMGLKEQYQKDTSLMKYADKETIKNINAAEYRYKNGEISDHDFTVLMQKYIDDTSAKAAQVVQAQSEDFFKSGRVIDPMGNPVKVQTKQDRANAATMDFAKDWLTPTYGASAWADNMGAAIRNEFGGAEDYRPADKYSAGVNTEKTKEIITNAAQNGMTNGQKMVYGMA